LGRSDAHGPAALRAEDGLDLVEVFSWWTAPGEAEALQALVDVHQERYPNARVFNAAAASGETARQTLDFRLTHGQPPDLFQGNAHVMMDFLASNPGSLVPLDDLFKELGLHDAVFEEIIEGVRIDDVIVTMPVNRHRENVLFYNADLLAVRGLSPPKNVDELLTVCEALRADGITPIVTSHEGWILRIMFNSIAMGSMGARPFAEYHLGIRPADDPAMREAIDLFAYILQHYTNPDAGEPGFGWTTAAQALHNGDAAMFFHGDWARGYLAELGWIPDIDFGEIGAPGASDMFWYAIDYFAIPVGAANEQGARNFLATVASVNGQLAFNQRKGSSVIRMDIPRDMLDPAGRAAIDALRAANVTMRVRGQQSWDDAFAQFARDRDRKALLDAYVTHPASQLD